MIKCFSCEHLRQVGWDYFCLYREFSLRYRIETVGYQIKEIPRWCPLNKIKEVKKMTGQSIIQSKEVKKLKDEQLKRILANIKNKRQDYEKDNFKAGYIQAMLNYGIISSEQYETIYK